MFAHFRGEPTRCSAVVIQSGDNGLFEHHFVSATCKFAIFLV